MSENMSEKKEKEKKKLSIEEKKRLLREKLNALSEKERKQETVALILMSRFLIKKQLLNHLIESIENNQEYMNYFIKGHINYFEVFKKIYQSKKEK